MLALRAGLLLFGFDRLPMVPTVNPEVIINDPALSLSLGHGYVAYSFEHSVNGLDKLYGHFPPVFIALQSVIFRLFGFSALTLRAFSMFCDLAACVVFLLVLTELYRQGFADRFGATAATVLIFLEPTGLSHSREARMESLNTLLGGIALYLLMLALRHPRMLMILWACAGLATGAALASHQSSVLMWAAFATWTATYFRQVGMFRWILINAIPPLVMISLWLAAWGGRTLDALRQLQHLAVFGLRPDLRIGEMIGAVRARDVRGMQIAGGLGLIFMLAAVALILIRLLDRRAAERTPRWRSMLVRMGGIVLLQCAMLQFVVPTSGFNRVVMIVPYGLVVIGLSLSFLSARAMKVAMGLVGMAGVLELGATSGFIYSSLNGWNERSPGRFDALVDAIPANARVAAPPELWFAFHSRGRHYAVIYRAMREETYWEQPHAFDGYDVVILDPNWPRYNAWRAKAAAGRPVDITFHTFMRDYTVVAKELSQSLRTESK